MNEPTHTKAVQTDLPSPKPNRRKRLALRFAVIVAAVSVLGPAYWFTRPPELVWWRSPVIGSSGLHIHALIPSGWARKYTHTALISFYTFGPDDVRPRYLRYLLPGPEQAAQVQIVVYQSDNSEDAQNNAVHTYVVSWRSRPVYVALRNYATKSGRYALDGTTQEFYKPLLQYRRSSNSAFNRTYRQICNSLTIE